MVRCTDPILLSFGDTENLEGLGSTLAGLGGTLAGLFPRAGLGGILSGTEITSKEETESAARTELVSRNQH